MFPYLPILVKELQKQNLSSSANSQTFLQWEQNFLVSPTGRKNDKTLLGNNISSTMFPSLPKALFYFTIRSSVTDFCSSASRSFILGAGLSLRKTSLEEKEALFLLAEE